MKHALDIPLCPAAAGRDAARALNNQQSHLAYFVTRRFNRQLRQLQPDQARAHQQAFASAYDCHRASITQTS